MNKLFLFILLLALLSCKPKKTETENMQKLRALCETNLRKGTLEKLVIVDTGQVDYNVEVYIRNDSINMPYERKTTIPILSRTNVTNLMIYLQRDMPEENRVHVYQKRDGNLYLLN